MISLPNVRQLLPSSSPTTHYPLAVSTTLPHILDSPNTPGVHCVKWKNQVPTWHYRQPKHYLFSTEVAAIQLLPGYSKLLYYVLYLLYLTKLS